MLKKTTNGSSSSTSCEIASGLRPLCLGSHAAPAVERHSCRDRCHSPRTMSDTVTCRHDKSKRVSETFDSSWKWLVTVVGLREGVFERRPSVPLPGVECECERKSYITLRLLLIQWAGIRICKKNFYLSCTRPNCLLKATWLTAIVLLW